MYEKVRGNIPTTCSYRKIAIPRCAGAGNGEIRPVGSSIQPLLWMQTSMRGKTIWFESGHAHSKDKVNCLSNS